jgi:hypothetical protein
MRVGINRFKIGNILCSCAHRNRPSGYVKEGDLTTSVSMSFSRKTVLASELLDNTLDVISLDP